MRLTVSCDEARKLILSIPHKTCAAAIDHHWSVASDGTVRAQSVLWLFCWAKTGMTSEEARQASVRVFNTIFPISFVQFSEAVSHEYARKARYSNGDIDDELKQLLPRELT
jgi:hypothetical protein